MSNQVPKLCTKTNNGTYSKGSTCLDEPLDVVIPRQDEYRDETMPATFEALTCRYPCSMASRFEDRVGEGILSERMEASLTVADITLWVPTISALALWGSFELAALFPLAASAATNIVRVAGSAPELGGAAIPIATGGALAGRVLVDDVNPYLGEIISHGEEAVVYELRNNPNMIIKIYRGGEKFMRGAVQALIEWGEKFKAAGLADKIAVVKPVAYGVDRQGQAFVVQPRVVGELYKKYTGFSNVDSNRELFELMRRASTSTPEGREAVQRLLELGNRIERIVSINGGNAFRTMSEGQPFYLIIDGG